MYKKVEKGAMRSTLVRKIKFQYKRHRKVKNMKSKDVSLFLLLISSVEYLLNRLSESLASCVV